MNNDELQVLGTPEKKGKLTLLVIAAIAVVAITIGAGFYWNYSSKQPEKIKTGKKMGESTILPELQHAVDSLLNAELTEIDGLQGQAIVMEVETGEILAMVGLERNYEKKYQPCKNFAYQQELGALMMPVSLLAMLETGKVKLDDVVDAGNGLYEVKNDMWIKDHNWRRGGYKKITLDRAIEVSSNIVIGKAVNKVFGNNQQQFFNLLEKMSFGQPDNIEGIDGIKPTRNSSPKDREWNNWTLWQSAIGYERKITPIQMLTFYNAIANNGKMVKPTLKTGEIEIINPHIARKENIDSMQVVLEHVVSQGLGKKAGTAMLRVAGMTATSQVNEYDYYNEVGTPLIEYQLAFCGYFPAEEPKYSIIVSMNKLGLPASGGGMAGVVFHNIVEWMLYHDMPSILVYDEETGDTLKLKEADIH